MSGRVPAVREIVTVWNKQYEVTAYQKSKSVWEAVGDYDRVTQPGQPIRQTIRVKGRSAMAAINLWAETARYRGQLTTYRAGYGK
jgi:hypothetical protein